MSRLLEFKPRNPSLPKRDTMIYSDGEKATPMEMASVITQLFNKEEIIQLIKELEACLGV